MIFVRPVLNYKNPISTPILNPGKILNELNSLFKISYWHKLLRPENLYLIPKMKNLGEFTIRGETVIIHTSFFARTKHVGTINISLIWQRNNEYMRQ